MNNSTTANSDLFGYPHFDGKFCNRCRKIKPFEEFYKLTRKSGRKTRQSYCKDCNTKLQKDWIKTPDGRKSVRNTRLVYQYDITSQEYDLIFEKQHGVCAVCGCAEAGKSLNVDHNHATGKVRGLLCNQCNFAIGLFKESSSSLRKAAEYLESFADIQ